MAYCSSEGYGLEGTVTAVKCWIQQSDDARYGLYSVSNQDLFLSFEAALLQFEVRVYSSSTLISTIVLPLRVVIVRYPIY